MIETIKLVVAVALLTVLAAQQLTGPLLNGKGPEAGFLGMWLDERARQATAILGAALAIMVLL